MEKKQQVDLEVQGQGIDSFGNCYKNAAEMWEKELAEINEKTKNAKEMPIGGIDAWYKKAVHYWEVGSNNETIPATFNGVLGGFGHTHDMDIEDSNKLLKLLIEKFQLKMGRALGTRS